MLERGGLQVLTLLRAPKMGKPWGSWSLDCLGFYYYSWRWEIRQKWSNSLDLLHHFTIIQLSTINCIQLHCRHRHLKLLFLLGVVRSHWGRGCIVPVPVLLQWSPYKSQPWRQKTLLVHLTVWLICDLYDSCLQMATCVSMIMSLINHIHVKNRILCLDVDRYL